MEMSEHLLIFSEPEKVRPYDRTARLPTLAEELDSDRLGLFREALQPCGLLEMLEVDGPFTVFAPVDEAMDLVSTERRAEQIDMLILITDGFFEWANSQDEEFGTQRLEEAVRFAKALGAADVITSLYNKVLAFAAGTPQNDDLTAIVLKRGVGPT